MTHQGWDNQEYLFNLDGSADGQAGKVWYHIRQNKNKKVIYFVNLTENNDLWNEGKNTPTERKKIEVKVQVLKHPQKVWFAAPNEHGNQARKSQYQLMEEKQSLMLCTEIEVLRCGILVIESN